MVENFGLFEIEDEFCVEERLTETVLCDCSRYYQLHSIVICIISATSAEKEALTTGGDVKSAECR